MRPQPINLIGGFYADDTRHWSVQDTVNWLPVVAELPGTRTESKLVTPPGLKPWQKIGTGPIRGMYDCEGLRLVVSGRTLYRITSAGVGIPLGTIPGVGRVSIAHNQYGTGHQVLVTNGQPGGGYVYDTTKQTFARVVDPGFPGSLSTVFLDGYMLGISPDGRQVFHSNLVDATDYNTLDRFQAEAQPDRAVGLAVSQFELIVFGSRTVEFFGNTGAANGTFQSKRALIDRGCASRHTIVNLDNSVFWLGDDGIVYRLEGYGARRVSTVPLEKAIAGNHWADAFAFAWEDRGHKIYYLTFPDGQTWGFDVVSGLWHRRESYGLSRWRVADLVRWGGRWYAGDMQDGRIWALDWDYPAEGDQPMVSERTTPVLADNQAAFTVPAIELVMGVGQGLDIELSGDFPEQPVGPSISGAAPAGSVGWEYPGYDYLVVAGDSPSVSVRISDGKLPRGLTWGAAGIAPGVPLASGRFPITVRATDSIGLWAETQDVIDISPVLYVLASSDFEGLWISRDLETWSSMYPVVPSAGNGVRGVVSVPGGLVLDVIHSGTTMAQSLVRVAAPPWGEYIPAEAMTQIESGSGLLPEYMLASGSVVVAWDRNGNHSHYHVSEDGGLTFTQVAAPDGLRPRGIARMDSGRWVAFFQLGPVSRVYYSDEEVPASWHMGSYAGGSHPSGRCVAAGRLAYACDNLRRVWRSENGKDWTHAGIISPSNPGSVQLAVVSNGNVIAYGDNGYGQIAVSQDNGETWTAATVDETGSMLHVSEAAGRLVGSGSASKFWVSDDFGLTWATYTPPFSGYGNAATISILELAHD